METSADEFVVRNSTEAIQTPKIGLKERVGIITDPRLRLLQEKINESEKNGIDKDTGDTVFSILNTTRKVVDLCANHPRLSKDFSARFNVEDGIVSRKSETGFIVARDPIQMANNFAEVSSDISVNKPDVANWMVESSLTNLTTWIGLAAEANPAILREINDNLDISKFGLSAEVTIKTNREKVVIPEDGKIPEILFSERLKSVRQEVTDKYGEEITRSVFICGGSTRSLVMGEDPLNNYGGDIDYAVAMEIPEETRKGINEIFSKYGVGKPDDLTDPDGIYGKKMEQGNFVDIFDAIRRYRSYSIDKIAVNISTREIFDPHNGLADLKNGTLRLVGEDLRGNLEGMKNAEKALILALRGARFGGQYVMNIDPQTENLFKEIMGKNKFFNRFKMSMYGLDEHYAMSETGKTYLKMLEKTEYAALIPKYLEKFGLLDQVSKTINYMNFNARLMWGHELRTIDDLVWERNYSQLAQESLTGSPQEGEDIRFTGRKFEERQRGPIKFTTTTLAISRMLSYLLAGL